MVKGHKDGVKNSQIGMVKGHKDGNTNAQNKMVNT